MQAQAPVVIVTQPGGGSIPQTSNWQTGLCDCFSDCGVCLCGIFCFSCLAVQVASDLNECCLCGTSVAMRTLYRTRYGIPVSLAPHRGTRAHGQNSCYKQGGHLMASISRL
uniref:Placenta associated 8 n=1 Tax=Sus scrofa TaxID=9823 RepID=A0A8D0UC04_PIG